MAKPINDWVEVPNEEISDWVDESSVSQTESALRGAAQGASLGFADELVGGVEALKDVALTDAKLADLASLYAKRRDESRQAFREAETANPASYTAGGVAGGLATMLVPGLNVAKGASLAKTVGSAALAGGLGGLGGSEADLASVETGKDVLLGAGLGGALGATGYGVGKLLSKGADAKGIAKGIGESAEDMSLRALGAERGTIKKLGLDKAREAGRMALDEGVVTAGASTDDLIERLASLRGKAGQKMETVYSAIDDAGASSFNPLEVASKVDEELGGFWRSPINKGETRQLENTLESILMRGDENIPLKAAQKLKEELANVANWKNSVSVTDKERMARQAYGIVSSAIDEATEKGAKQIGSEGLLDTLQAAKKTYGAVKTAEELVQNKQARELGNKMFGLTDTIVGAGGLAGGTAGVAAGGGIMAAKKLGERYGAGIAATSLDKLSKAISNNAEQFGKYSTALANSAKRGAQSLAATNFILQQRDPDYRKKVQELDKEEE